MLALCSSQDEEGIKKNSWARTVFVILLDGPHRRECGHEIQAVFDGKKLFYFFLLSNCAVISERRRVKGKCFFLSFFPLATLTRVKLSRFLSHKMFSDLPLSWRKKIFKKKEMGILTFLQRVKEQENNQFVSPSRFNLNFHSVAAKDDGKIKIRQGQQAVQLELRHRIV